MKTQAILMQDWTIGYLINTAIIRATKLDQNYEEVFQENRISDAVDEIAFMNKLQALRAAKELIEILIERQP
jgi:hypothetical protein